MENTIINKSSSISSFLFKAIIITIVISYVYISLTNKIHINNSSIYNNTDIIEEDTINPIDYIYE